MGACCTVAVTLAACGGGLPRAGAPSAPDGSWMLPEAKGSDLLYAANGQMSKHHLSSVLVFAYPSGRLVGTLTRFEEPSGECVDASGDVFITNQSLGTVKEYAHGGTSPIEILIFTGPVLGCSIDPTTGNLAVASSDAGLLIWQGAKYGPIDYFVPGYHFAYCGYDANGNLFADALSKSGKFSLLELPQGGVSVSVISVDKNLGNHPGQVQFDGTYVTVEDSDAAGLGAIYRLAVSGSSAKVVGQSTFAGVGKRFGISWIAKGGVLIPYASALDRIGLWNYPAGGKEIKSFGGTAKHPVFRAVALSPAAP